MSELITNGNPIEGRAGNPILMHALRYAPAAVAARYPLEVAANARWTRTGSGWAAQFDLPDLPNDCIVVPSVALFDDHSGSEYRIELTQSARVWTLCPTAATACADSTADPSVTTHIDYFHCRAALPASQLTVTVAAERAPDRYLIALSARAYRCTPDAGVTVTPRVVVPAISQLTAPRAIRHRICSPTCVTMALSYHGRYATLARVTEACYHAPSHLFGVWPLAIRCAAASGMAAAAECFADLDSAARIVASGLPVVASIRFASGALPGAALAATDGHLVVVTGLDADWVYINDPAARDASVVPRQCPREAFSAAWLTERGVGYVLSPL
jgi:uncharacterized protein YvpB